jgi:MarR family transcriptional regulator for hemolysin
MSAMISDWETFGPLLHGTARAWRQKLDERLKPMGLSQAKWRTLLHLSLARDALTQAEIAGRLGVEEPTVVALLHRLEKEGWITRRNSTRDRRCKMVLLGRRAQRVITRISATADELRHELLLSLIHILTLPTNSRV